MGEHEGFTHKRSLKLSVSLPDVSKMQVEPLIPKLLLATSIATVFPFVEPGR